MASLIAKINRGRASAASAKRSGQHSKVTSKNKSSDKRVNQPKKPKKAIAAKPTSKKAAISKAKSVKKSSAVRTAPSRTASSSSNSSSKNSSRNTAQSKKAQRISAKSKVSPSRAGKTAGKAKTLQKSKARVAPPILDHPKPPPSASTLAAVRAFEHALKLFNRHDFSSAKASFEALLEKHSDQAEVIARSRTYLAICEQRSSRVPAAPKSPDALYDQGVYEFNRGNTREAISCFERALKSAPRADHIWYSLAAAQARLGNSTAAVDALRRAIIFKPVHRSHARRDPDFHSLRDNEGFQLLIGIGADFI